MQVLGITGGVGMGKSTAGELLHQRGIPVVDTDVLAREVVEPGQPGLEEVVAVFGREVLDATGRLNRAEVARRVFGDAALRQRLEAIVHPRIRERWLGQIRSWRAERRACAAVIIPLLFETSAQKECDVTICVTCSPQTQQKRLRERGWTAEQIAQRLAAQWPTAKKMEASDFVVWTEGSVEMHAAQWERLLSTRHQASIPRE